MAKSSNAKGMNKAGGTKRRGRLVAIHPEGASPARPNVPQVMRREANRPVTAGGTKHRGDRRDTSRTYTTTVKHAARGNTPRADVKTRKR